MIVFGKLKADNNLMSIICHTRLFYEGYTVFTIKLSITFMGEAFPGIKNSIHENVI